MKARALSMKVIGGTINGCNWRVARIVTSICDFLWLGRDARLMPDAGRNRALAISDAVR